MVAVGKRRKVKALDEYRQRFAYPADRGNHPSGPSLTGEQVYARPRLKQSRNRATQPERDEESNTRLGFEGQGPHRRDVHLKTSVAPGRFFASTWTLLDLIQYPGHHGSKGVKLGRNGLIAVTMACAILLGEGYLYRTMKVAGNDAFQTSHVEQFSHEMPEHPNRKKLIYERLTPDGSEIGAPSHAIPPISAQLPKSPSTRLDNRVDPPFAGMGKAASASQPVEAKPQIADQPTVVRSERYRPDGTRIDIAEQAPVPSIVRLGAGQVHPPFLAAVQPPVARVEAAVPDAVDVSGPAGRGALVKAAAEPAPSSIGGYFAQVESDQDEKAAEAELAAALDKYRTILGGVPLLTRPVDLKQKGVWFRVLAGPLKSRDDAKSLCKKLKSAGLQNCIVQKFD
ncbi:MAG: SPOR domain-containing protein [Rhodomicrobium sp.]